VTLAPAPPARVRRPREAARDVHRTRAVAHEHAVDVALAVTVVAGAVLRLWDLGMSKLSYDESFTAMAGRLPTSRLFAFLTAHDSHPPLDYLLRAPLARAGVSELWFRMPSALCSIAALVLLAMWLRPRGRVAVIAVALLAISAFEVAHGRDARMYAELEPIGVGVAWLTDTWLRRPARGHALALAALLLAALFTHVSAFLLAAGLLTAAGLRTDRNAWWWRLAIVAPIGIWAVTWGPHFVVQARGGHSTWIPSTSFATFSTAIANAVTFDPAVTLLVCAAIVAGGVLVVRDDRALGRTWISTYAIPLGLAAAAGLVEPVVLDRTFTLMAWAPALAIAWLVERLLRDHRVVGALAAATAVTVMVPGVLNVATHRTGPTVPLTALEHRIEPGDVVAVRPAAKAPELQWSLAVRGNERVSRVEVAGLPKTYAVRVGTAPATGRVWYLDWRAHKWPLVATGAAPCAPTWRWGATHIDCLTGRKVVRGGD
jgi:hypothetical protein